MSTLPTVELGVLGPLQVRQYGLPVAIPGAKPRAILTMLGLYGGSVVSADTLLELLWGDDPPRTAAKALQTHISSLRRSLGDGFVLTEGTGWTLSTTEIDAIRYKSSTRMGRDAVAAGDTSQAVAHFDEALALWRGTPELPDGARGVSEKTRWIEGHAALVEDRADALLATGRAAEIIGDLEAGIADAPLRERRWGQLMLALYRAGRQGEALGAYQRARSLLADELGVDPGPDLRRLEAAIIAQDVALEVPVSEQFSAVTRAVTFLLTDIEGSTAAWEADADAMAVALARHDELVEQVVTSRGGRLIKTRGEGDATFSVFDRPSAAAAAAIELQEAIRHEPWALSEPMRIRVALHTGEVELRDGDYFGRAVNRAARLRSLAAGGQILCSGATAELVIDSLSDDVILADLGMRHLRNLARPEHVFELRLQTADELRAFTPDAPMEQPALPAVLAGPGPFVGRGPELERLLSGWQTVLDGGAHAVLIAGEPGVGKTRLAGEWSRHAYEQGAVVLYGRCDEDLGAPYQPFAEALRALIPCLGTSRLRGLRGVEALLPLVPGLTDVLPDLAAPTRADPDTERYALFDAVVAVLGLASTSAPVVLILDDLHWAAKPTLLLLRHLLRFGEHTRVQIVGTYRSTDLDRSHPLAAMLADLHRDGSATRLQLSGLDEVDVSAYVAEAGYDDEDLARALASVTGGNPFFLIEALRHVDESGGRWDPSTLPQGVREAVSRRLSRLPAETNKALAAAAVVGSRFALELVERVVGDDLVDAFDEASKAGIVIEEPGGRYRFNHAIVRQSLLAELASVRRMRLHQRIAATLETEPGADDELLADLAYHYFECAWAGNAAKAVDYCRRAADQAMARLAYEGAADLYDRAVHALEEVDEELPDRGDQQAELLVARCEALLAAGDVVSAAGAVSQLQAATRDSARLAAWGTCFDGQLSMLTDPERLDEIESAVAAAAEKLAGLDDAAGEAKAHTVRAGCLARLGRIGDAETALDHALTAARRAREHRRVNAVLAGAPLAALWGPNPVPRAGGRCLDVVRLLRITTGSPVVEATSTRCQAVLDALRGRAAAGRSLLDSARRALTELGMRHALLEVDQFAGILELVADDPAAAEAHLRRAYNGFRRMGLDADTAETAALLARACLALDRDTEADELCTESERLAGHALKASIAWRAVRAQLLARSGAHDKARRVAEEAVALAARTDLLVDHGDACLALATVLNSAGDSAGARASADEAVGLYELKGAAALAENARHVVGEENFPTAPAPTETPSVELGNACVRVVRRLDDAYDRDAWEEVEQHVAAVVSCESRRKVVGLGRVDHPYSEWATEAKRYREILAPVRYRHVVVAVRGERLALTSLEVGPNDQSPGAPRDELLQLYGLDQDGRIALQMWFDVEDIDTAIAELDAAHARLEERQPQTRRLGNAANEVVERYLAHFPARDWGAMAELLAEDISTDDRRHVANAGVRLGRATEVANVKFIAEFGATNITSTPIATRGERLVLAHHAFSLGDWPDPVEVIDVVEINAYNQISAQVVFDPDDIDAAFVELDTRYLAGEAAPYGQVWRKLVDGRAAMNRHEPLPTTWGQVTYVDHRRVPFAPEEFGRAVTELWTLVPDAQYEATAVHALDAHGTVIKFVIEGTDAHGSQLQWPRTLLILFGDGETRMDVYEVDDVDTALTRFEELRPQERRLENGATRITERYQVCFSARDWAAMAELLSDDTVMDDRRRVVNAGLRQGRDVQIADMRAAAEVGAENISSSVIATRGERLALARVRTSNRGLSPGEFGAEMLGIVEIDADERVAAIVAFDVEDTDAAFEELDDRYLAGEAAPYRDTWLVITRGYAALNRREMPATSQDWVNIDHRRSASFEPGDLPAYIRALWDVASDVTVYIEAVHRVSDFGALVSSVTRGRSHEGFDAEWPEINLVTVDSELITRSELFDHANIEAALARFDDLGRPAPSLENAASNAGERFLAYFAARDWDAMAELLANDYSSDDRRRVVSAGIRQGRDAEIINMRAIDDLWITDVRTTVIATRSSRLTLMRARYSGRDEAPESFLTEILGVIEINADDQISALVVFEADDFDAAITELDARYLAGEAAAYAHTWSLVAGAYAAFNRRELLATTPDWVNVDHRRGAAFAPGDMIAYIQAAWDDSPDTKIYIAAVHRLSNLGAVVTHVAHGISQEGFAAEWRDIHVLMVEGDMFSRSELFDEADVDAALARFEQLSRPAPQLENAASRVDDRFEAYFADRDWNAMADMMTDTISIDDRRSVVNAGLRRGRDDEIASLRATAGLGVREVSSAVIAIRGERLALSRNRFVGRDQRPEAFHSEALCIIETDAGRRITARVTFDVDDIDAAFEELDARYLAGEAAAHSHTWSVIAKAYAALNRGELPATTPDMSNIDHRRIAMFAPGDLIAFVHAAWDLERDICNRTETVHRLNELGALVTRTSSGTSREGFDAEWREIDLVTVEGDLINRFEVFDEADFDTAAARFDELSSQAPRLENAASRMYVRFNAYFADRDWDAMAELLADDVCDDDRRRVVSGGIQRGRDAQIANLRAVVDVGVKKIELVVIATRGERLALSRARVSGGDQQAEAFGLEMLSIVEIDTDDRIAAGISFDVDDIDAAFEELDARHLTGEAAPYSNTWSLIAEAYASIRRHELPPTMSGCVNVDHRRVAPFAPGDLVAWIRTGSEFDQVFGPHMEVVHRLTNRGAVITYAAQATSPEGFDAEWREISLSIVEGDMIIRCELFDEADIQAALARFDELDRPPTPRLENAASQVDQRFWTYFAARDWAAIAKISDDDICIDDRRRVVNAGVERGRDAHLADMRAIADIGAENTTTTVVATRGNRLALTRVRSSYRGLEPEEVSAEVLCMVEVNADNRIVSRVGFDVDDIDAALAELDARYIAGEASAHSHTWSVVTESFVALNRHELPALTADCVQIDHRPLVTMEAGNMAAHIRAFLDEMPNLSIYIEAVQRLTDHGAVFTHAARGASQQGFDAEWRMVELVTVESDLIIRCELFDEADLDAALVRFDELSRPARQVENAATQTWTRLVDAFNHRDEDGFLALMSTDGRSEDRRKGLGAVYVGPAWKNAVHALFDIAVSSWRLEMDPVAVRGSRLSLTLQRCRDNDAADLPITVEFLTLTVVGDDDRMREAVTFDPEDIDAAFEELDARYLAGEAAAHAPTWSVIAGVYTALNRRELPATTPDWVNMDHRRGTSVAPGDLLALVRAAWDVTPDIRYRIEAVHRLSSLGAVVTHTSKGTSQQGFDAEWRVINLLTLEGDAISRCEMFEESDLDIALARFDELSASPPQLENAATRAWARIADAYNRRDLDGFLAQTTTEGRLDDRRKLLRASHEGPERRKAAAAWLRAPESWRMEIEPIAIRGDRLGLTRERSRDTAEADQPIVVETLTLTETNDSELVCYTVLFDPDDINGAIGELTARWIASGEVAHPEVIEAQRKVLAASNRHDWDAVSAANANATYVNHRQLPAGGDTIADHMSSTRMMATLIPDLWVEPAQILTHSALGLVTSVVLRGTSTEGLAIEIPVVLLSLSDGDHLTRIEIFDPDQRDLALTRFDELNRPA